MSLKTEYNNFNDDDFVQEGSEMKELTVTITLCEYRNLLLEQARADILIDDLHKQKAKLDGQVKTLSEMVLYDHPEFYSDMFDTVVKFLKKANGTVSDKGVANNA